MPHPSRTGGPPTAVGLLFPVLLAVLSLPGGVGAEEEAPPAPTITVLGARVEPLKMRPGGVEPKGRPWDADHKAIPNLVYRTLGPVVGLPPLAVLALIPYRNRPDPYVVVRLGDAEIARSRPVQGAFAPVWHLAFRLPPDTDDASALIFEVFDDDLQDDDRIGEARAPIRTLLAAPGAHRLEGTGGLHDLSLVVRHPAAEGAGDEVGIGIRAVRVKVRPTRPAGGDWDAGGNPLRRRFPRLPVPDRLRGLESVPPDLQVTARWGDETPRTSPPGTDSFELSWEALGWQVRGRPGTGDGLLLEVADRDLLVADPVGAVYLSLEDLISAPSAWTLVVEPDDWNGIERLEVDFQVEETPRSR